MFGSITISAAAGTARGNSKIGNSSPNSRSGIHLPDLQRLRDTLVEQGFPVEIVDLSEGEGVAHVLVARGIFKGHAAEQELMTLQFPTTKAGRRTGEVVNCVGSTHAMVCGYRQEDDPTRALQRVWHWEDVPHLASIRERLVELLGRELYFDLIAYPDVTGGIGFHGDRERQLLAGVRFGPRTAEFLLRFRWYKHWRSVGAEMQIQLEEGDLYVPCEKATGWDAGRRSVLTLRHAAGADTATCLINAAKLREKRAKGIVKKPRGK